MVANRKAHRAAAHCLNRTELSPVDVHGELIVNIEGFE
jgi:hypothetical protein